MSRYTVCQLLRDRTGRILVLIVVATVILGTVVPVQAQPSMVDTLLARIFGTEDREPYELTANFTGSLDLVISGSRVVGTAVGTFREWRTAGQPRHWKVTIQQLDLPMLIRPFSEALRRAIEDKASAQLESLETLRSHDLFILDEQPDGRYVLAGIRHDLVDEAIDRYGHPQDKQDIGTRRQIARWLYTSPSMQDWIVRKGGPYALHVVADEHGLVHDLVLSYDWGQVNLTFAYVVVARQPIWREVTSAVTSEVHGFGQVNGQLTLTFSQHRLELLH